MNILELDSFNLADAVKFNDQLNPRIWQGNKMRPEVREKLLEIAADFKEFLGLSDLDVKDITVSGSNAAYTYTPQSDIDLHLVVDIPQADADEVYRELFDAKKYQYNDLHNIKIGGYDVELYVENANKPPVSKGVFSVLNNDWISIPRQRKATVDDDSVRSKYEDIKHRIEDALKSGDTDRIDSLARKIKAYRQAGLDAHGELGSENLAYKMLRNQGYIKKLYDARADARAKELSLNERKKKKKRVKYGFARAWGPVFDFSDAGEGGDAGGMAEDATLTPDGVNPTTCMFLNEKETPSHTEIIFDFMKFAVSELGLKNVPSLKIKKDPQWSVVNKSFGRYRNDLEQIELAVGNRHIMDVLRTLAHELQHRKQDEREKMPPDAGETGSPYENEAHVVAGILMRQYADLHPEYFEDVPVAESASGYIPRNKKEARDPRYAMALTVDIKPGETGKQANKMALKTDRQGRPGLLMKTANMIGEATKYKGHGYGSKPMSQVPGEREDDLNNQEATGPEFPPQMPAGTTKIDVSDLTDWYRLGMDISDLDDADPADYGKGPPQTVIVFPSDEAEQSYLKQFKRLGLKTHDMDPDVEGGEDVQGKHLHQSLAEELQAFKEQDLFEVKMTSKNLAKLAKDIPGVKVGLEFEMIVPNASVEDEGDMEPDYEQDERVRDIDDAVNFFDDGDYNSSGNLRRLRDAMQEAYWEWRSEQVDNDWWNGNGFEYFQEYLDREYPFDEDDAEEEGTNELQAQYGDDLTPEEFRKMLDALIEQKREAYVQEKWDDQGSEFDDAKEEYTEERYANDDYDEEEWLRSEGIRHASDVENTFGHVTWPYYTSTSSEGEADIEQIALDFMNSIGADSVAYSSSYHGSYKKWVGDGWVSVGSNKPDDCFSIEPDGSLDGDSSDDVGLEFVSPPIPLEDIGTVMQKVQNWASNYGAYTGKRNKTSIHTNISVPDYDLDKLDYLKAALLLGDEYVLREFDRIGNTYAAPAIEKVKELVRQKPEKAKELLDKMKSQLNAEASKLIHSGQTNKFTSINTKDNRVEFRSPGGDYLDIIANNPQKMMDTINRMVITLDAAMDPNKYKEEYQKKLYKVLTGQGGGREAKSGLKQAMKASDKDLINIFTRYAAGELPKQALKSFVRQAQLERNIKAGKTGGKTDFWWHVRRDGDVPNGPGVQVVAKTREEALTKAAKEFGLASPEYMPAATATPVRPYDTSAVKASVGEPQPVGQQPSTQFGAARGAPNYAVVRDSDGTVVYRFYADDRSEALGLKHDFVQMQGWGQRDYSLRDESESTAGAREYEIFADADPFTVVRSFYAADDQAAQAILDRYRQEHPGTYYRAHRAPVPGSTLDLQRRRAAAAQQSQPAGEQSSYELYRISDGRTVTAPAGNPIVFLATSPEDAESKIERYVSDFGLGSVSSYAVRSVINAPAQQSTSQGNWGIWMLGADRFANQPGEYPRGAEVPLYRFPSREAAEQWLAQQRADRPGIRTDIEVREIEPREPLPDLFPELPGTPAAQQGSVVNYELYNRDTGEIIDTFPARNDNEAMTRLNDYRQFGAGQSSPDHFGVRRGPGVDNTAPQTPDQQQGGLIDVAGETPAATGQFTGEWKVVDPNGNEIYRFSGVGNAQSDANRVAMDWLRRNPRHMQAGVEVLPVMS